MIHHISKSLATGGCLHPLRRNGTQSCARMSASTAASAFPDYFGILGVGRTFTQSPDELKAKYKNLMTKFHPDRHTTSSEEVKSQKASMATDVTRAYSVIEDPLARALHLLELHGQAIGESDSSIVNNTFLMEIMEAREEVENASSDSELRPLLRSCQIRQSELCRDLEKSFAANRMDDAKIQTAKLQYWKRIEETIMEQISSVE